MKVFYHADADGRCAGYWVRKLAEQYDSYYLSFHEINYGMEFPFDIINKDEQVFIVDYSIFPEEMEKLLQITKDVTWIDHHQSAIERYIDFAHDIKGIRYDGIAGCELTYCYLRWLENPTNNVEDCLEYRNKQPLFSKYIGDFDVWKFEYGEEMIKAFEKGLKLEDLNPESKFWDDINSNDFENNITKRFTILRNGRNIIDYEDKQNESFCKHKGFECEFEGLNCFALNMPGVGSDHFKSLDKDYDMWIGFSFDGEKWTYALRSKFDNVDCSKIAMKYGGGGHKGAAGFQSNKLLLEKD